MPSEARQKKIVEKLNRAQKCSILGPQNLGSGGGPGPPPGSAPGTAVSAALKFSDCALTTNWGPFTLRKLDRESDIFL